MNGEPPKGVDNDLLDVYLFNIEMVPKWSKDLVPLMTFGRIDIPLPPLQEKRALIQVSTSLTVIARIMYNLDQDNILRLCIETMEKPHYLQQAHVAIGGIHMAGSQTLKRVLWLGVWWPTMRNKVYESVRKCHECQTKPPRLHATLF